MAHKFPDELCSNDKKKSFEFARDYASAIWDEWENRYNERMSHYSKLRKYALGIQCIKRVEDNITNRGKLIKKEFLRYDKEDRVKVLPQLLRNFYNSIDMNEFIPVVRAIDPSAMEIKTERKNEKLKLFYAKDFIEQEAQNNGGQTLIPLSDIPQSKEQIQLEEEAAKPLRVERAELKAIEFVALMNDFHIRQDEFLRDMVEVGTMVAKIDTDPVEGIKIERIAPEDYICGKGKDIFYSDSPYHGLVKEISVSMFKNIAAESGLKFSDEEIKKMAKISEYEKLSENVKIKVLFYSFKTFFQEVYKKKTNRNTKAVSLIDRTKDVGTDKEYNPKQASDISEKIVDNYDVWFEGVMVLDINKTIIRHRLMKNMPEHRGKMLPPFVACSPRKISLVEECIPKVDAIQELRLRITHHRNNLKGDITEIDPDAISNIVLGDKPLTPQEVLSYYFSMGLAFRKTKDEDGDFVQNNRPLSTIPESIPRALIELTNQYISEIQSLQQAFGAIQYEMVKPDPKTLITGEPFRLSDNTALRDYTNALFNASIKIYQTVSTRINDAFGWNHIRDMFIDNIGTDDMEAIEQYRKDRKSHFFSVYLDYVPSQQERADFLADLSAHVQNGTLDALDKWELSKIRNPDQARASLRLRLEAKKKEMQDFELRKIQENQNQNVQASMVAYENKAKLSAQEHQQKIILENQKTENEAFLLMKQGEIKILESANARESKMQIEEFRSKFNADLTAYKKDRDEKLSKDNRQFSAEKEAQLIKLRKGEISDISNSDEPEIDLSQLHENPIP